MSEKIIKEKRTPKQVYNDWLDRKFAIGWKRYAIIAPPELIVEMKAVVRKFKAEHSDHYPMI
jgi:hypothetical protein